MDRQLLEVLELLNFVRKRLEKDLPGNGDTFQDQDGYNQPEIHRALAHVARFVLDVIGFQVGAWRKP